MKYVDHQVGFGLSDFARDSDNISYVTAKDASEQDNLWRERNEDAYVSIADVLAYEQREQERVAYWERDEQQASEVRVEGELLRVTDLEHVIRKQAAVLNVYRDKAGNLNCGSVELRYFADGTPVARCRKCRATLAYAQPAPPWSERHAQEDFVLAVVAHGHNHQTAGWWSSTAYDEAGKPLPVERDKEGNVVWPVERYFSARSRTPIGVSAP